MSVNDDTMRTTEVEKNSEGFRITYCTGPNCGAAIVFTETLNQKRTPVNAEPAENGNIALEDRGDGRVISHVFSGHNLQGMRNRGASMYLSHYATCPDAEMFRR